MINNCHDDQVQIVHDNAEKYYSISTKVVNPIFDSSTPESGEFWDYKIIKDFHRNLEILVVIANTTKRNYPQNKAYEAYERLSRLTK